MGLNPTEIATQLPVSVQTVRALFSDFRDRLGTADSHYYYAAFHVLDQHWPEKVFFGTMKALQKMGMGFRFQKEEIQTTYDCVFSCPASLPPKRLKKAYDDEAKFGRPTLVNPTPMKNSATSETHDRISCRSCPNKWLRKNVSVKFLDNVGIHLSYYRGIKRNDFGPYFLSASLVVMLERFLEVQFQVAMDEHHDARLAEAKAHEQYGHLINVLSKLAFDVLSGREMKWRDMKDEDRPGLEGLY